VEGAAQGTGLGFAFLRHVQRCKTLLHVVDGTSEDPIGDFITINNELKEYDPFLAEKPQVVVLNKIDVPEVKEQEEELLAKLREAAGHSRVLSISAATTERVKELMGRLKKFSDVQPEADLPPLPEIDLATYGLDFDSDDYGTWRCVTLWMFLFVHAKSTILGASWKCLN
jgi:GTP-binding protein